TDEQKIAKILDRGVQQVYPSRESVEKRLYSDKKLKIYLGIDPTGADLHLGHTIALRKLQQFQDAGHQVILLIGDFTARIGDPTGKGEARNVLTPREIKNNFKKYKKQAGKILDFGWGGAQVKFNSRWLSEMDFQDVIELSSQVTHGQMIERDMFQDRIKNDKPIYMHEFMYPLMQGYDSVAMDVDGEVGGNDQTFNMLMGRTLMKNIGKDKFVIPMKLLTDNTGKKMGKTEGNMVLLDDEPNDMYGKIMAWDDSLLASSFELLTDLDIDSELIAGEPMNAKKQLAHEIVRMYHSTHDADGAQDYWENTFSKRSAPDEMMVTAFDLAWDDLVSGLVETKIVNSKTEARRLIDNGAITNLETGEKVTDVNFVVKGPMKLKIGKKRFIEIKIK
ncbi:MAG: tyrosine--tRNA ligase, partial [Candidatus Nomurabacteria bacterium]|nr:tyrosine--tRNA ligase [Candidatus Nomurabacteria bacterium]